MKIFKDFCKNEQGGGIVEYALILALVAVVAIAVLTTLGGKVVKTFSKVTSALS